jgi:O-antigen/teichoic acid export membrane protein
MNGMQAITSQLAPLMLGTMQGAEAVAIYTVANRGAQLISFILGAVNTTLAPTAARLYAVGDMQRLQGLITKSARVVLCVSLPIAVGFIVFGDWFLWLFGTGFMQGHATLRILSIGLFIDAAAGSGNSFYCIRKS